MPNVINYLDRVQSAVMSSEYGKHSGFSLGVASDVGRSAALPTKGVFGGLHFRVGWELLFFVAIKIM